FPTTTGVVQPTGGGSQDAFVAKFNVGSSTTAVSLSVGAPSSISAGTPFSITVTARDASNNVATGYLGTVHFTQTDANASAAVPADYTFTVADNGVHTFTNGVTFVTANNQTVTATDAANSLTGNATVNVSASVAHHFSVSAPTSSNAGTPFSITV